MKHRSGEKYVQPVIRGANLRWNVDEVAFRVRVTLAKMSLAEVSSDRLGSSQPSFHVQICIGECSTMRRKKDPRDYVLERTEADFSRKMLRCIHNSQIHEEICILHRAPLQSLHHYTYSRSLCSQCNKVAALSVVKNTLFSLKPLLISALG